MGHCYDTKTGAMVCDICGKADGTTRTRRCPHDYCPGADVCAECWASEAFQKKWTAYHIEYKCKERAAEWRERQAKERAIVESGGALRIGALGKDNGIIIHVVFEVKGGTVGRFMSKDTYNAFPLLRPTSLAEFEQAEGHPLAEAPSKLYG